jgi:hypothetical protein
MTKEQRTRHHMQFMWYCAAYIEHRFRDWVDAKGHDGSKNPFWIDLWDPELLMICEDINLDDHPRVLLKFFQWEHHVTKIDQVMEKVKK